jgi:hypothetical protein
MSKSMELLPYFCCILTPLEASGATCVQFVDRCGFESCSCPTFVPFSRVFGVISAHQYHYNINHKAYFCMFVHR